MRCRCASRAHENRTAVVYVDSVPLGDGGVVNDELPVVDGEIPLPNWSVFGDEDLTDLDDGLRERLRAVSIPESVGVATDRQVLRDRSRYDVPITVITCEFPAEMLRELVAEGHAYAAELVEVRDAKLVDLPTGHWPQFTKPAELGAVRANSLHDCRAFAELPRELVDRVLSGVILVPAEALKSQLARVVAHFGPQAGGF